jgi:RNA polymerase sigma-70 factor (ECF subfamily)
VVESPNLWQFDAFGQAEGEMMGKAIAGVEDVVIGRKLWNEWSEYWPGASDPFGEFINPVRKHVVSTTLTGELPWNSTLIEGDPADYVRRLKDTEGGGIAVVGGIETTRALFTAGVIDALTLTTHPVVGEGRRLFDDSVPITRLQLLDSTITPAGNAVLTYALRPTE